MTTETAELSMETSRVIGAPRERVFDAWLDPDMLARFMMPKSGMSVPDAASDARVGGRFRIIMRAGDQDMPHEGTYKVIDRPNRLSFTWEGPFSTVEDSTVTLDFDEVEGGTKVTLRHVRFVDEESRKSHTSGWAGILEALDAALT